MVKVTRNAVEAAMIFNTYDGVAAIWRDPKDPGTMIVSCQPKQSLWVDMRKKGMECLNYHKAARNGHPVHPGDLVPAKILLWFQKYVAN